MTVPCSGEIKMSDIRNEFQHMITGDPNKLTSYYGVVSGIPASGKISYSDFRCKSSRIIKYITADTVNVNTDNLFTQSEYTSGAELILVINPNITVGSNTTATAPLVINTPNVNTKFTLRNFGSILGAAGNVSNTDNKGNVGFGGTAIKSFNRNLFIDNHGIIYGGGGRGGYGGQGGAGGNGKYVQVNTENKYQNSTYDWIINFPTIGQYTVCWGGATIKSGIYNINLTSTGVELPHLFDGVATNTLNINGENYTIGVIKEIIPGGSGNYTWNIVHYDITRSFNVDIYTTGGIGGVSTNWVIGRGYNNQQGSLANLPVNAGQAGGQNAGWGGNSGISGAGGNWGQSGTDGTTGNTGGNGNVSNGIVGVTGGAGGQGGYLIHMAYNEEYLPEEQLKLNWVTQGNIQGNVVRANSGYHSG